MAFIVSVKPNHIEKKLRKILRKSQRQPKFQHYVTKIEAQKKKKKKKKKENGFPNV